jgi:Na+/H+ antiporter NhaD/arsenite permease-like protein
LTNTPIGPPFLSSVFYGPRARFSTLIIKNLAFSCSPNGAGQSANLTLTRLSTSRRDTLRGFGFVCCLALLFFLPSAAWAEAPAGPALPLPVWSVAPFAILLLAIALLPLFAPHFWESNLKKGLVAGVLAVPLAVYLCSWGEAGVHALLHELGEYASFIILLGSLYIVAGGILLRGDIQGRPWTNTGFLALGAILANLIGTTGASMLLIRPMLRINSERKRVSHIPIFFIFIVSNLGGLLTPLGDPPLFLGFLKGVDFIWTLQLWPQWVVANGALLCLFLIWDLLAYSRESPSDVQRDVTQIEPLRVEGLMNVLFLVGILVGVLGQSRQLAGTAALPKPVGEIVMVIMAVLSWLLTPRTVRVANKFRWHPIIEVAVLFAGIFVTMVPALVLLEHHGAGLKQQLNVSEAWHYFWLTGILSSFLDNAPTYVTFATLAAQADNFDELAKHEPLILAAISCGAVFMGANTYIGNGPNFMVKAIAEDAKYKMPSFFGYMLYSGLILLPLFVVITFLFFPLW